MRIETSAGKAFPILAMCEALRNPNQVLIELEDDRPLTKIIPDFDGLASIRRYHSEKSTVYEMYEGFTRLVSIQRNTETGRVRLMLEKDVITDA